MKTKIYLALAVILSSLLSLQSFGEDRASLKSAGEISGALSKRKPMSLNAATKVKIDIHSIQFTINSSDVEGSDSYAQIRELAKALDDPRLANSVIEVEGHTCSLGDDKYNLKLSEKRAKEVVKILSVQYGIDESRLVPVGKGESDPLQEGDDEESRSKNRRVTFVKSK